MRKIEIQIIPHQEQRYNSPGDYWVDEKGDWQLRISDLGNTLYNVCVALHELAEFALLDDRRIKEPDVLAFDEEFEQNRTNKQDEPGFAPDNDVYQLEHMVGTAIEMLVLSKAGKKWSDYESEFNKLQWKK